MKNEYCYINIKAKIHLHKVTVQFMRKTKQRNNIVDVTAI